MHSRIEGAYSVIIMLLGYGIIAFRDPSGIRPLIYGSKQNKKYMIASERVVLPVEAWPAKAILIILSVV